MIITKKLFAGLGALTLAGSALFGFQAFSPGASAGQGGALDDGKDLQSRATISLSQAVTAARTASTGAVDEVDLEYWHDTLVYNIDVGSNDVKVDAATGVVLDASADE